MDSEATLCPEELLAHAAWIRGLARSLVGDPASADDLVQETWLAALRRPPLADRSPRPWLARVMHNFARARLRDAGGRGWHEGERAALASDELSTDELVEHVDAQRLVADLVVHLAEPFRSTVLQRYYQGRTSAEIARRTGVPAGTVRWRLKRGLELLRDELDERHGGDRGAWCALLLPLAQGKALVAAEGSALFAALGLTAKLATVVALVGATTWLAGSPASSDDADARVSARTVHEPLSPTASSNVGGSEVPERDPKPADERATVDGGAHVATERDTALLAGPKLRVRVVDPTGVPLAGASVRVEAASAASAVLVETGGDGEARVELAPTERVKTVALSISAPGRVCRTLVRQLKPGDRLDLGEVELEPGGRLSGVVLDSAGRPAAGARVVCGPAVLFADEADRCCTLPQPIACGLDGTTDDSGAFVFDGVPAGFARVFAREEDSRVAWTDALEVHAGESEERLEIVLAPDPSVRGRIVGAGGAPRPDARVVYRNVGASRSRRDARRGEEGEGSFAIEHVRAPGEVEVFAWSADAAEVTHGPVVVGTGTRDARVELEPAEMLGLAVESDTGVDVEAFTVVVHDEELDTEFVQQRGRGGEADVPLPPREFSLRVSADGHREHAEGPFVTKPAPDPYRVILESLSPIRGVVVADGEPVARAIVGLYALEDAGEWLHHGLPLERSPVPASVARTDRRGRFTLSCEAAGEYVVRAERRGRVPVEIGPLELDPANDTEDLRLEFSAGGAIEGRVRTLDGEPVEGAIVAATRGDHAPRTAVTDADGQFAIDDVMPGDYWITRHDREIYPGTTSISRNGTGFVPAGADTEELAERFNCHVEPGEVARVELEVEDARGCRLVGRLAIDGGTPVGWYALLARASATGELVRDVSPWTDVEADGDFELELEREDERVLCLYATRADGGRIEVRESLFLEQGETPWNLDLSTGTIEGIAPVPFVEGEIELVYEWRGEGSLRAFCTIEVDADGRFVIEGAPAGVGRIVRPAGGEQTFDPGALQVLGEVVVSPGDRAFVDLR